MIISRDAKSACFKGSRASCDGSYFWLFLGGVWPKKIASRDGCVLLIQAHSEEKTGFRRQSSGVCIASLCLAHDSDLVSPCSAIASDVVPCAVQGTKHGTFRSNVRISLPNTCSGKQSGPPKRGQKTGAARKFSKSVENIFDIFWFFLTCFTLRENCRKSVENIFDTFLCFVTLFDVAPFR